MPAYPSRILIVGNGGRENALGNALLLSPRVEWLGITPANYGLIDPRALHGGSSRVALFETSATDSEGVVALAREQRAELVVIGPEAPLVAGLADALRAADIPCVGPDQAAAQLEGSKRFAKQFMARHGVPTAGYREFADADSLLAHVESCDLPVVLKADGLAAGKGVSVCLTREEARDGARAFMVERVHGDAAGLVIVEEFMTGPEISFICLVAGGRAEVLPPGSDYKRLRDSDLGPNTGGMGNICPTPHCDDDTLVEFVRDILAPTVRGLKADGLDYRGFLFVGTMLTPRGLKVVEYNVRFGDPEAEVMLPLCDADWPTVLAGVAAGELPDPVGQASAPAMIEGPQAGTPAPPIRLREGACVAVVLASAGYPESKGAPAEIEGLDRVFAQGLLTPQPRADGQPGWDPPAVQVCFAGVSVGAGGAIPGRDSVVGADGCPPGEQSTETWRQNDARAHIRPPLPWDLPLLASGGRVLCISARAQDLSLARRLAYEVAGNLHFEGMQLRTDIGKLR